MGLLCITVFCIKVMTMGCGVVVPGRRASDGSHVNIIMLPAALLRYSYRKKGKLLLEEACSPKEWETCQEKAKRGQ